MDRQRRRKPNTINDCTHNDCPPKLCDQFLYQVLVNQSHQAQQSVSVMLCGLAARSPCFEGTWCLILQAEVVQEE
jgi:hypothetical protein